MCAWLYWSFYYERMPDLEIIPPTRLNVLLDCLDMVEKRTGTTIPEGSNPDAQPRLLTLDPVSIRWRPLIHYLLVALSDFTMKQLVIRVWGMTLGSRYGLDYLVRVPPTWDPCKDPTPIVFIYGLGLGLLQYSTIICSFLIRVSDRLPSSLPRPQEPKGNCDFRATATYRFGVGAGFSGRSKRGSKGLKAKGRHHDESFPRFIRPRLAP